jgi:hypothetical protein
MGRLVAARLVDVIPDAQSRISSLRNEQAWFEQLVAIATATVRVIHDRELASAETRAGQHE